MARRPALPTLAFCTLAACHHAAPRATTHRSHTSAAQPAVTRNALHDKRHARRRALAPPTSQAKQPHALRPTTTASDADPPVPVPTRLGPSCSQLASSGQRTRARGIAGQGRARQGKVRYTTRSLTTNSDPTAGTCQLCALQAAAQLAARSEGDSTFLARTVYAPYVIPCLRQAACCLSPCSDTRYLRYSRARALPDADARRRRRKKTQTPTSASAPSGATSSAARRSSPRFASACVRVCAFALRCLLRRGELLLGGRAWAWAWDVCGRILVFSHHALRLVTGKLCCSQPSTA